MVDTPDPTPGRVFDEVPEVYDRSRPGYPPELFRDLAEIAGLGGASVVLEVGSGTGQATRDLARVVGSVTAVEPGPGMIAVARRRLAGVGRVGFEDATFERWDDRGRTFDALVAASAWHWIDPVVRWRRAHDLIVPGGVVAVLDHVVVRRPGDREVYAETADLHERFSPGNGDWGDPPWEDDVFDAADGDEPEFEEAPRFERPLTRRYPMVQAFDGAGFADLLRTLSPYRRLAPEVREPLVDAVADRIRDRMDDRARRRYVSVLRVARRAS